MNLIIAIAIGIVAGICSGLFGIGGGIIIVPLAIFLFGITQQAASGTSLVALLLPVGIFGVIQYYRSGVITNENIKFGLLIALGMFLGTFLGAKISLSLDAKTLSRAFSVFLVLIAIRLWTK